MKNITPKLGEEVVVTAYLERRVSCGIDDFGRHIKLKSWERHPMNIPIKGLYVGRRMKSNGSAIHEFDGGCYSPVAYFEAWLVAFADSRDFLVCLPSDVQLVNQNDTPGIV